MPPGLLRDTDAWRLAAIVESSDDAIVSKDLNGVISSWNRAAEHMFGFAAAEAVGRSITLIIPEERLGEEAEVLNRIRNGQSVEHFETIRRHKNGTLIPISLTVSPIRDDTGRVIGASKIARDISERRRIEAAIAQTEATRADLQQRLLTLTKAAGTLLGTPDLPHVLAGTMSLARQLIAADAYALWRIDADGGTWRTAASHGISPEFISRIDVSAPTTGAVPFSEPWAVEDVFAEPMLASRRDHYQREGISSLLVVPLRVGGHESATLVFYYRQRHVFGDVEVQAARALGSLAAAAIHTAELYAEQRISSERAQFLGRASAALGASLDYQDTLRTLAALAVPHIADWCAVDVTTGDGAIERLAVAHVDSSKVAVAHQLQERGPASPTSSVSIAAVIRTGKPVVVPFMSEAMLEAALGDDRERLGLVRSLGLVSYMCVPLRVRGRSVGAITFASAESGRRFSASDLPFAEDVAVRAGIAVENARAYEEARQANRVKDAFLATLSHELRTPLNAILGYTQMMRQAVLDADRQQHALAVVERNAEALRQMVNDVLDVSGIVTGKLRLKREKVNLAKVVAEASETMLPAAEARQVAIEVTSTRRAMSLTGDGDRLRQVFWNLLSNAVKFTPSGGRVRVRLERSASLITAAVTDTGAGVPAEFLPHMFEPFRQAGSPFTREHGGLGLGLAITRHIVEMHGGTIQAASEGEGKGTTMTVKLPVR